MSNIEIHELSSSGSELFEDSESFLDELSDEETTALTGGRRLAYSVVSINSNVSVFSDSAITANANSINANTASNFNSVIRR